MYLDTDEWGKTHEVKSNYGQVLLNAVTAEVGTDPKMNVSGLLRT